jgi:DNA repair and recombination protein RAD52
MFNERQKKLLADVLDKAAVKTRAGPDGRVPYLDGFTVFVTANEIFGPGNYDCETVEMREVHPPVMFTPPPTQEKPHPKAQVVASYACKVRVTIWDEVHDKKCVREAWNAHRAFALTVGEAVEAAITGAETQATKRAMRTAGFALGLALYDREQRHVGTPEGGKQLATSADKPMAAIDEGFDEASRPKISERAKVSARPNGHMPY